MKISRLLLGACALSLPCSALLLSGCAIGEKRPVAIGSIRPAGGLDAEQLPALTKISFDAAHEAAEAVAPGRVIKAELEVEDGNLQYSFKVIGNDGALTEIEIDAGNGKVLDTDKESVSESTKAASLAAKAAVSFDDALKTAFAEIPGGTLLKGKIEEEHGLVSYEFKLLGKNGQKAKVEVNAATGKILKIKKHGEAGESDKKA